MKNLLLRFPGTFALMLFLIAAVHLGTLMAQGPGNNSGDVKMRQKMTTGGRSTPMESVIYVKGSRMRTEMAGTGTSIVTVRQCDLERTLMINDANKTYFIVSDGASAAGPGMTAAAAGANTRPSTVRRGGVVNLTNTIIDTGERKEMFGFTARRVKTSTVKEASADACNAGNQKIETDGWYIDFQYAMDCPDEQKAIAAPSVTARPDCEDEIRTRSSGAGKLGFPVFTTTTVYGPDGTAKSTITNEVTELSREPLDTALFDVPQGYALASNYQQLYRMGSSPSPPAPTNNGISTTVRAPVPSTAGAAPDGFVSPAAPKKDGSTRIGIVMPKAQMTSGDAAQAAQTLRNTLASYLTGPNVELVAISARLPSEALQECRQSQCDYILYSTLTQKKGGGGMFGKALGSLATSAIGHLPGGDTAGEAAARSVAVSGVYTAADISRSIKSKDEMTLEYKLDPIDPTKKGSSKKSRAKANSDGEDVFTPLVEKAAESIVDSLNN